MNRLKKNRFIQIATILLLFLCLGMFSVLLQGKNQYLIGSDNIQNSIRTKNTHPPDPENISLSDIDNPGKSYPVLYNKSLDSVIAKVGTKRILLKEFIGRYTDYLAASGVKDNPTVRSSILANMINEIALRDYDNNENILNNINYKQEVVWTKSQVVLGFLKDREIFAKITVTDAELRQTFKRVNEKLAVRHLYAPTEEEASRLYKMISDGVNFETLAKQTFSDSILSNNGGYLGYFTWGDMDPDFEDAAFSLKIGEISKPVKTAYGWSIIKLEDRIPNPIITENDYLNKKHHLERILKIKKKVPAERAYLNKIFDPSKLNFDEKILASLLNDLLRLDQHDPEHKDKLIKGSVIYNGEKISIFEIKDKINQIPCYYREKIKTVDDLKEVITGLLLQEKLLKIACSKGYDKDPLVNNMYEKLSTMTFLKYKREEIINNAIIPDSVIRNFYVNNIKKFSLPDELNLQEIIVPKANLADSLKYKLADGADFGLLAAKYSIREWTSKNNGIMGYAPLEKFGSLKDKFWNAPLNKLIGPIKIQSYYGLFKVIGKRQGNTLDFSLVKADAEKLAKKEIQTQIIKEYLVKLKNKIPIDINEDLLFNYKLDPVYVH